ncbi:cytochrome P450 [Poronia punctata]|nr:cytochrome P450 [Poronia punctata]
MLPTAFALGLAYLVVRTVYRLYFHPLSHIPGPKIAAVSHLYELYHDAIRGGMYIWEVEKMHKKYGPVVRINPREVHIKDPHFYDEVYAPASRKREKDGAFVGVFGFPLSMIATVGHEHHRIRRSLLNAFFSKKQVQALAGSVLAEQENKLIARLTEAHNEGRTVRLDDAYAALTADTISQYSWGRSSGFLDDPSFKNDIRAALDEISQYVHIARFFPIMTTITRALPRPILRWLRPAATAVLDMQDMVTQSSEEKQVVGSRGTVFDALRDPSVSPEERSKARIEEEGLILVVAGTETTARTLTIASYHLFGNRPLLLRLREELCTIMPRPDTEVTWSQLEQLPLLNGVVNESIRLSFGPIFRSTRVAPTESLVYKKTVIPPKTPISMSTYFVHMDEEIFPEPASFKPERWIESQGQHLTKFITAFGKGSRNCLGMNLAYAELYLTLAAMIRRFEIELVDAGPHSIRIEREMGIGQPIKGDFIVQAKIKKIITE